MNRAHRPRPCGNPTRAWRRLTGGLLAALALLVAGTAPAADAMPAMGKARAPELGSSALFAPDGQLLAVSKQGDHVLLYRSGDAGQTWSAPAVVNAAPEPVSADGENRPKLALTWNGAILVTWTRPLGRPYSGAIRLARAEDGKTFAPPLTVHRDPAEITHRFESLAVGPDDTVLVTWIDKRDLEAAKAGKSPYRGAAIYSAVSHDGGKSFAPERKVADHSCECCRIAVTHDRDGAPLLFWRHVFTPNERDHALARLKPDGTPESVQRATFDRWKIDGCPHHGPSLAVDGQGRRHGVWFNEKDGAGRVHYGRLVDDGDGLRVEGQRTVGGPRAAHADLIVAGRRLAIAWKEFDGERTRLHAQVSQDGGQTFLAQELAATEGASDQPRLLARGEALYVFWRTEKEHFRVLALP
ncbi:MAG: exo-alpha-sialidase [Dechloromonas sp.]|nr:exo-alpha-sialidase [Dechloromonas sp.]